MSHLSKKGIKALEGVAKWLEAGAPHVEDKYVKGFNMVTGIENKGCGTTCCIAGAVVQFNSPENLQAGNSRNWTDVYFEAIDILGISNEDAKDLFLASPGGIVDEFSGASEVKPEGAAKVVRNFIATGEVDWDLAQ